MSNLHTSDEQGFTIVELMIATTVLSIILILSTILMINIGNLLYKGINVSRVQDAVRNITDQTSGDLKLSDFVVTGTGQGTLNGTTVQLSAYCIGNRVRYSYIVGNKIGTSGAKDTDGTTPLTPHVLWRDNDTYSAHLATSPSNPSCVPVDITSPLLNNSASGDRSGEELISPNSRLTAFCISSSGDCTNTPTSPYTITVGAAYGDIDLLNSPNTINATCKGDVGDHFCGTSSLITVVGQRLTGGS